MKTLRLMLLESFRPGGSIVNSLALPLTIGLCLLAPRTCLSQGSAQRDQQALAILAQTIAAAGGSQSIASIQDFTEKGTVEYNFADPVTGSVTVKGRGLHQIRIDADLPKGMRTTVVNGKSGSMKEVDGRSWPINGQSAADLGSFTLPLLPLTGAMIDSSTSIIFGGLVNHNGSSAYDIRLQTAYTQQQDPTGHRGAEEARDFYIDPKTFLVVAVSGRLYFRGGPNDKGVPHEILYSNWQSVNGIMMPLAIVESVRGVTGFTIELSQVTYNSGLSDSDFAW